MVVRILSSFLLILILFSCSKKNELDYEPSGRNDPYKIYKEAFDAFEKNDFFYASKKFSEAELNFDEPKLAAKSAIMSCFSLYGINFYKEAEQELNRFMKTYPVDENIIYAHYLMAIVYYEQIQDEKKDLEPLLKAKEKINFFINQYPNTDYTIDLKFKKDLIENQLAAKELYIAKYYISVKKWVPAINRLKIITQKYSSTIFIEEALHRLVEINYHLGIEAEAKKYAKILGYNYNSSQWFEQSYKILNKDYKVVLKNKTNQDKENFLKRILKMIK